MSVRPITTSDIGRIARVRHRQYLVDDVRRCEAGSSTIVRLSCIDPDNLGRPLEVMWEKELDAEILSGENWGLLAGRGFDPPEQFSAYYHTPALESRDRVSTGSAAGAVPGRHQDRALSARTLAHGTQHAPRQPLRGRWSRAWQDDRGRLDRRELLLRRKVSEIVVCCPPSMLLQWKEEMESRFGLIFQVIDRSYVHRIRKERGYNVNPWGTHSRFIISHNLIKDEEYASDLRNWLGRDLVRPRSLLILDEAHHAAPAAAGTYAITSQFTRQVMEIAPKFEHKLFLSATPHNGHSNSFQTLMSILDPQRFCPGVPVGARERDQVLIYRLKEDLRDLEITFPKREVEPVLITAPVKGTPELELANTLDAYCELREARLRDEPIRIRNASAFLKSGLQQRLLSSVEAFWRTLLKHKRTIEDQLKQHGAHGRLAQTELDDLALAAIGGGVDADDDVEDDSNPGDSRAIEPVDDPATALAESQTEKATLATVGDTSHPHFAQEMKLLDEMLEKAEWARHQPDEKIKKLISYIDHNMFDVARSTRSGGQRWNGHRILIFTEYDDTLAYVRRQLEAHIQSSNEPVPRLSVYKGSTSLDERQEIKEAFNADPAVNPVRILLATDAAREGLNLQKYCFNLFHYDIPWNPARLEQRNGRIDRKLQPAPTVYCRYFLYENREEDAILRRIVEKTENIYRELGGFGTVLDKNLIQTLRRRGIERTRLRDTIQMLDFRDEEEDQRAAQALAEVSGEDDADDVRSGQAVAATETAREKIDRRRREKLDKSLARLRKIMEESRHWLDFRESQFRAALDCSLRLMEIEGGLKAEPAERAAAGDTCFPRLRSRKIPPGARRSTACAVRGAAERTLAPGTRDARSGRLSLKIPASPFSATRPLQAIASR